MDNYIKTLYVGLLLTFFTISSAQTKDKVQMEIEEKLKEWNDTAKKADLEKFMSLYDNSSTIILVGSDKGEVFEGKQQINDWLTGLFKNNSFEWEMNTVSIDHFENTAWVFVDGAMIVTNSKGIKNQTPYRFTGILIKKNHQWKWRLFNGSIPQGE